MLQQFQQLRQTATNLPASGHHEEHIREPWRHGTRILLNVEASSPVILVPVCSTSEHLLVIDLGKISISNQFEMSNGSLSRSTNESLPPSRPNKGMKNLQLTELAGVSDPSSVLVDVLLIELSNMDICTGQRQKISRSQVGDLILGSYLIRRSSISLLENTCEMKIKVKRNLDSHLGRPIPDMDLCGLLSTVQCSVDEHQYKLIRGLLAFNLGENVDALRPAGPPVTFVQNMNDSFPSIWATMKLRIDLVNVILIVKDSKTGPFSTIKFIDSRLVYESNSDGSKDVDLVSQQVVVHDTRYDSTDVVHPKKVNVFTRILEPVTKARREGSLQAEVHYRSKEDFTRFTVVLNNMRVLAVFDWWLLFQEFLVQNPEEYRGSEANLERLF